MIICGIHKTVLNLCEISAAENVAAQWAPGNGARFMEGSPVREPRPPQELLIPLLADSFELHGSLLSIWDVAAEA